MPINVFRLEAGKKKRVYMVPGLSIANPIMGGTRPRLNIVKGVQWMLGGSFPDISKIASDVYVTSEVDDKISKIEETASNNKTELEKNITDSLGTISQSLSSLQGSILKDEAFRKAIIEGVIEELDKRSDQNNPS